MRSLRRRRSPRPKPARSDPACFPGKATTGSGDRRPSPAEIALCAPWLGAELAIVRPEIIVLVGTLAIERLWGPAPLSEVVGRSKRSVALGGALLIPLPHPSGASRWLNQPENQALLRRAILLLRREAAAMNG